MARVIITDLSEATIQRYAGWNVVTPATGRRVEIGQPDAGTDPADEPDEARREASEPSAGEPRREED